MSIHRITLELMGSVDDISVQISLYTKNGTLLDTYNKKYLSYKSLQDIAIEDVNNAIDYLKRECLPFHIKCLNERMRELDLPEGFVNDGSDLVQMFDVGNVVESLKEHGEVIDFLKEKRDEMKSKYPNDPDKFSKILESIQFFFEPNKFLDSKLK